MQTSLYLIETFRKTGSIPLLDSNQKNPFVFQSIVNDLILISNYLISL